MPEDDSVDEFEKMVADSIDRLPEEFRVLLEKVPVVISEQGAEANAYGQYFGDGLAREMFEDSALPRHAGTRFRP